MPAVAHGRGQRQRLARRAGAVIRDPHARPRIGQQGDQLAALVLHLDQPVLEGGGGRNRLTVGDAQPPGRIGHRLGRDPLGGQGQSRGLPRGAEQVGAQVERGRRLHGRRLGRQRFPETGAEAGQRPSRQVQPHLLRHGEVHQRAGGQAADQRHLLGRKGGRGEAVAGEVPGELLRRPAFGQQQMRDQQAPCVRRGAEFGQMPIQPQPLADHAPGQFRHGATIAAADEAAGAEEIIGDGVRRAARLRFDGCEQVCCCLDPACGRHAGRCCGTARGGANGVPWARKATATGAGMPGRRPSGRRGCSRRYRRSASAASVGSCSSLFPGRSALV